MEKTEAGRLINGLVAEIDFLRGDRNRFEAWQSKCRTVIDLIFGDNSHQSRSFLDINYGFYEPSTGDDASSTRAYQDGLERARNLLRSCIWQFEQICNSSSKPVAQMQDKEGLPKRTETPVNILVSWSKKQSKDMASAFHDWLPKVVPGFKPWMSSKDIDKGKQWFGELQGFLGEATSCIICVTKENVRSPWIYYETGAIAVKEEGVLVCPYLVGIGPSMISDGPLSQFQCTEATKEETLGLINSLNKLLPQPHNETMIAGNFESKWPEFKLELDRILSMEAAAPADFVESEADLLAGYQLSAEARKLLLTAATGDGMVIYSRSSAGFNTQAAGQVLNEPKNRRSEAIWEQAAIDLATCGLIKDLGYKGEVFQVTAKGYEVADSLKGRGESDSKTA